MRELMRKRQDLLVPAFTVATSPATPKHELIDLRSLGMYPQLAGGDRGYNTEGDVLTQTIDGRSLNDIWTEFQQSLQMYNDQRQRLIDLLTFPVTTPIEDVPIITTEEFEEASEFGEPKGITGGGYYSIGYDFTWYDLAVRYTWKYLAEATSQQVESLNNMALEADNRLLFNKVMRSIFNDTTRTANIREQAVNVYPFWNADTQSAPPPYKNYTFTTTHDHYLASGAATVDSGDLDEMATHIRHHGHAVGQGGQLILLANEQEIATIRGFRVANGDSYDFIPAQGQAPFLLPVNTGGIQGGQPPAQFAGMDVAGRYGPWIVLQEDYVPAGYLVGLASGGEISASNPVGIREHQNAGLRGLRLVKGRDNDYPLIDSFYQRGFGTGVRQRGAGVVMQITINADYTIPAAYA